MSSAYDPFDQRDRFTRLLPVGYTEDGHIEFAWHDRDGNRRRTSPGRIILLRPDEIERSES